MEEVQCSCLLVPFVLCHNRMIISHTVYGWRCWQVRITVATFTDHVTFILRKFAELDIKFLRKIQNNSAIYVSNQHVVSFNLEVSINIPAQCY